jgi:hypothetical protein
MTKEKKLCPFVDSIEDNARLQRKKTRLCEHSEADECLYKWFLQKRSERVPIPGVILKAQAIQFNRLLVRDEILKFLMGGFGDGSFDMGCANLTQKVNLHLVIVQQQNSFLKLCVKRLQMLGTLMNNCTAVMKQHCTTNCFQTNL